MGEPIKLAPEIEAEFARRAALPGHQQKLNAYTCDTCRGTLLTIDVVEGVTPVFLACRKTPGCAGTSVSAGYPQLPPPASLGEPTHEWYRPDETELGSMPPAMRDHVLRGGLVIRERAS